MTNDEHVRAETYEMCRKHPAVGSFLARLIHDHRLALCPECRAEWQRLAGLQGEFLARIERLEARPSPASAPPLDDLSGSPAAVKSQREKVAVLAAKLRTAKEALWAIKRTPPGERRRKVRHARCRFRSRAFAELLIEESRTQVRADPETAAELAALVPLALAWTDRAQVARWAPALLALAEAHRANALRIIGDLTAAAEAFVALRREIGRRPLGKARTLGEIASLEASLCIDQRRLEEAEGFLERAALAYDAAGDATGLAKVRIQQGILRQEQGHAKAALKALDAAADTLTFLDRPADPYLVLCTVTPRVNALCDLGRFGQAGDLLAGHLDTYEACEEPHVAANLRFLQGRVYLGLERWGAAAESFADAGHAMSILGRQYDAAIFALYEAEAYYTAGRLPELRRLAGPLVQVFHAAGVKGEALRALQLFRDAVLSETVSTSLLAELRQRVAHHRPALHTTA